MGRLFYLINQGFENVWKNKVMFIASVFIVATTMITLGIFTIVGENANAAIDSWREAQKMRAWLNADVLKEKERAIEEEIKKIDGISQVEYVSKEDAINDMREQYKNINEDLVQLTEGWENYNDAFTAYYYISLKDLTMREEVTNKLSGIDGINRISYTDETFSLVIDLSNIIKIVVIVVFIILLGVSYLVISNTIKLVLHSRRNEISIMKYIGATDGFIKMPFVIEAVLAGLSGAIISWLLTNKLYEVFKQTLLEQMNIEALDLSGRLLWINVLVGIIISCFACLSSIKKYLKV